ncbi:MAG: hypothetical protein ACM3QU_06455 [Verrucomicrobiota bacterium]
MAESRAVVSCHVEQPLEDAVWIALSDLQARRPGGFEIAALMRPPDAAADESESLWLARARILAARGPFGLHTHWGGAEQARPTGGEPAALVREQVAWLDERGLRPRLFAGGGWYMDEGVALALAELGVADCTATAFRPPYLEPGAERVALAEPARLWFGSEIESDSDSHSRALLELPATHSLGMAARAALGRLPAYVHVYFHDTDLLDGGRRRSLEWALRVIGRRRRPDRLDRLRADADVEFSAAASAP